ncbi:MAG: NAD-dependent epimerase/dehydratase family protein [Actinomycetota bacterium]
MRLLTIGGGRFSGRALTGQALERGHDLTIFHRGSGPDDPWPEAEHVHGDRAEGFGTLEGRTFDAVVDFCGYVPRELREAAAVFAGAGRYAFISSVSAHREDARAQATEDDDIHAAPFPDTEEITWETYGPLKVASELEVTKAFGDRALVIRPGYIVGPYDPTDRFTYWLRRAARGGRMLAPGPADQPMQWIDARDLAAFVLDLIEAGTGGTFSVIGAPGDHTLGEVIDEAAGATGAEVDVVWADDTFVRAQGLIASEQDDPFPMITPDEPNAHLFSNGRAVAAGLRTRSLAATVRDTLAWDDERGAPWPLQAGLTTEREAALLGLLRGPG